MAGYVPSAPNAPTLGIPSTGAAAETKALFGVLLDRGQDFINRTVDALNALETLPSQIVPTVPVVSWTDPAFTRPTALAGARPEAPVLPDVTFTRPTALAGVRPEAPVLPEVAFARPPALAGARPEAPLIPGEAAARIILDWLADPDPAVRRAYEAATFARAADRAVAEGARLSDEATSRWAAAGFSLPPGMLNAQLDRIQGQVSNATLQASYEAMTRAQDLQIQKYTLCIQQVLGAITDIYKAETSVYVGDRNADSEALKAEADVYGSKVQALGVKTDVYKAQTSAYVGERSADAEALRAEASVYEASVQALGVKTDVYKAQTSAYVGERSADAEALRAEASVYEARVQAIVQRVTMDLRASEIENNVMIANLQLIEKAMGEIAQTYAQLAAGATSAIHASTGFEDRAQYTNSQGTDWRVDWSFRADY